MASEKRAVEAMSIHADGLIGKATGSQQFDLMSAEHSQLMPLFHLAERLHQNMPSVQPSPAFVRSLGKELADNARHQVVLTRRLRRAVLIGAAAVGSLVSIASLVGAAVFVIVRWRERAQARSIQVAGGQPGMA